METIRCECLNDDERARRTAFVSDELGKDAVERELQRLCRTEWTVLRCDVRGGYHVVPRHR